MNDASPASEYDSSSSRWQAPQLGAALKSISSGLFCLFACFNASSASLIQLTAIAKHLQTLAWSKDKHINLRLQICMKGNRCGRTSLDWPITLHVLGPR